MKNLSDFIKDQMLILIECVVDAIIVEENSDENQLLENKGLIVEHEVYKQFGKSTRTYRIDKGDGSPGHQTHIHVYSKSGQLYAMNIDGTTHDGSKAQLSKKDQKTLTDLGFQVPKDGILEWINLDNRILLLD